MKISIFLLFPMWALLGSARSQILGSDSYGHTFSNLELITQYEWIDITGTGTKVVAGGVNISSNAPLPHGIDGPVELGHPFTFYGTTHTSLVPTSNGYLSTDPQETGADNTPYCTLPAKPSEGQGGRIYVQHRAWQFTGPSSGVYYQYFPKSPHSHAICGVSVFTWAGMLPAAGGGAIASNFQVLLFDHGDIIMNVQYVAQSFSTIATVGIQNFQSSDGLGLDCTDPIGGGGEYALLFTTPEVEVSGETAGHLQAAIGAVPPGGKLRFRIPHGDLHTYEHTFTLNKPMTLMGVLQSFVSNDLAEYVDTRLHTDGVSFRVDGAQVNVIGGRLANAAGSTFVVESGGGLTLCESTVANSGTDGVVVEPGGRLFLNRTAMESSRLDGGDHVLAMAESRVKLYRSVLIGTQGAGIRFENDDASKTGYDLDILSSSIVRNEGTGIYGENIRARIVNSTISNNLDEGIHLEQSDLVLRHSTVADQKGAGLWLGRCTATLSHNLFSGNRDAATDSLLAPVAVSSSQVISEGYNLLDTSFPGTPLGSDQTHEDTKITPLGIYGSPVGGGTSTQFYGHPMMAHLLLNGSPAIDVGGSPVDLLPGERDIRGAFRAVNGTPGGGLATLDAGAVEARSPVVVTTAADQRDTPAGPQISLREAMRDGSRILFHPSLNGQLLELSAAFGGGTLNEIGGQFVDASNLPDGFTISGGQSLASPLARPFYGHGLIFEGGRASAMRGGWYACFSNSTFRDNKHAAPEPSGGWWLERELKDGGAIFTDFHAMFTNCRFEDNEAGFSGTEIDGTSTGGAIAVGSSPHFFAVGQGSRRYGALYLVNSVFENNRAATGALGAGAVGMSYSQRVIVDGCTFSGNLGGGLGGITAASLPINFQFQPPVKITRSAFINNTTLPQPYTPPASDAVPTASSYIGALALGGKGFQVSYCTFKGNEAGANAAFDFPYTISAGALAAAGVGHVYRCTIVDGILSSVQGTGAAGVSLSGDIEVSHSIFDRNWNTTHGITGDFYLTTGDSGDPVSGGYNLASSGSAFLSHPTDLTGVPVRLSPLHWMPDAPPVLHPRFDSPAIDGGGGAVLSRFDQRGVPVSQGAAPDIGAVETLPPTVVTTGHDGPGGTGLSLRDALDLAPKGGFITFHPPSVPPLATVLNTPLETDRNVFIDAGMVPGYVILGPGVGRCLTLSDTPHAVSIIGASFTEGLSNGKPGGGIMVQKGSALTLSQSAVYQNFTDVTGAGIHVEGGTLRARNVTFANNSGPRGAAISADGGGEVYLDYSTVWGNVASVASAVLIEGGSTLSVEGSVFSGNSNGAGEPHVKVPAAFLDAGGFNRGVYGSDDYGIGPMQYGNGQAPICPPLAGSPVVDAGGHSVFGRTPREDARGFSRPYGLGTDIGAVELGAMRPDGQPGLDDDGDGMDDFWEVFHGLNPNADDSASNLDGDDFTALEEYLNGTDPNSPDSFGPVSIVDFQEIPSGGWELSLDVPRGGLHELQVSGDLADWDHVKFFHTTNFPVKVKSLPGEHPENAPRLFFRVKRE